MFLMPFLASASYHVSDAEPIDAITEFMTFARNHDVQVSLPDLPEYIEKAKELGVIGK